MPRPRRRPAQLALPRTCGWGGARPGAGRKRQAERELVPHRARAGHRGHVPEHVTLRAMPGLDSLRDCPTYPELEAALRAASRDAFRVVHFSVQHNHLHLIVEASDHETFVRGLQGLAIRCARAINRAQGRRGRVWEERYHRHPLTTPSEVRRAIVYVLENRAKSMPGAERLDPCSSAWFFDGWHGPRAAWSLPPPGERPVGRRARTWLLAIGWRRAGGTIRIGERPKTPRPRARSAPRSRRDVA